MLRLDYQNPIQPDELKLADPYILSHSSGYYLYGTSALGFGDNEVGFEAWYSRNLIHWSSAGEVYCRSDDASWNRYEYWGPVVYFHNDRFYLFFSAHSGEGRRRIGVARSNSPLGPFLDSPGDPLTPGDMDCLDPHVFVDDHGVGWLVCTHHWTQAQIERVLLMPLSDDWTRVTDEPAELVRADKAPWSIPIETSEHEVRLLQSPRIEQRGEWYYLLGTARGAGGSCVGYFRSRDLAGPYESQGVVLNHDAAHPCLITGPDGYSQYLGYTAHQRLRGFADIPYADRGGWQETEPQRDVITDCTAGLCIDRVQFSEAGEILADETRGDCRFIETP